MIDIEYTTSVSGMDLTSEVISGHYEARIRALYDPQSSHCHGLTVTCLVGKRLVDLTEHLKTPVLSAFIKRAIMQGSRMARDSGHGSANMKGSSSFASYRLSGPPRRTAGKLTVLCGPMFARKTTTLLRFRRHSDLLVKPKVDTRYSDTKVVTHDGVSCDALSIDRWPEREIEKPRRILFDEIQFFTAPHYTGDIVVEIGKLVSRGKDVVVAGLDRDWRGSPFPITASLLELADTVVRLPAVCTVCKGGARYTWRKDGEGEQFGLGSAEIYEARCVYHHPLMSASQKTSTLAIDAARDAGAAAASF